MSRRYSKYAQSITIKPEELTAAQIARLEGIVMRLGLPFKETLYDYLEGIMSHRVTFEERWRPDLISWKWYQDPQYWELIMEFNDISDHLTQLVAGMELLIPTNLAKVKIKPYTYLGVAT